MPTPPAPHGTPAPTDSSWSFSTDRAVITQFCPPGESVNLSVFVSSSLARIVPTSAFAAQSHNSSSNFWIGDSGASCHMTNDASKMYCETPPSDQRGVVTSDGTRLRVEHIGNIDVLFHGRSEEQITLIDVSFVPGLKFNLFSFHKAQQTHAIILDAAGVHTMGKNLTTFPCKRSGSYLRATRLAPGSVGAKPRTNRALASQISAPLSSCVPSFPPSVPSISQFSSASKVSGTDAAYGDLLEPIPSPPVRFVLEKIEFGRKPLYWVGLFFYSDHPEARHAEAWSGRRY